MEGLEIAEAVVSDVYMTLTSGHVMGVGGSFIALIFLWSGMSKLRRPAVAAMALVDFRVTRRVNQSLGKALGLLESSLGILILAAPLRLSFLVSAALLTLFSGLILRSLVNGEAFPCQCFGDTRHNISMSTFARTFGLACFGWILATASWKDQDRLFSPDVLEFVTALGILGTIVLIATIPSLLLLNSGLNAPGLSE